MKEIPIIFQTEMVKATIAGRKTNTRRFSGLQKVNESPDDWDYWGYGFSMSGKRNAHLFRNRKTQEFLRINPRFGFSGDWLYVRENWQHTECLNINPEDENYGYVYQADGEPWEDYEGWRWKPSIHLPKKAAIRWLRNTADPIPERLQDISEADAIAEGIETEWRDLTTMTMLCKNYLTGQMEYDLSPKESFKTLICSIHGPEIWAFNPYMWRIQFEVLSTTGKPELKSMNYVQ